MNILDTIIASKQNEVSRLKKKSRERILEEGRFTHRAPLSLKERLIGESSSGVIAEFKRRSPSKGEICAAADPVWITRGYADAGAAGLSVLTDHPFFGGSVDDLLNVREAHPNIPILRKEFIIDPHQVAEARACGADVILLIAACLSREEVHSLTAEAKSLGLEVLLEIHGPEDMEKISPQVDLVGVNNRNLKTFAVDVAVSLELAPQIPGHFVKISESGISSPASVLLLREAGYRGFLIGESFMKTGDPGTTCAAFISALS